MLRYRATSTYSFFGFSLDYITGALPSAQQLTSRTNEKKENPMVNQSHGQGEVYAT